MNQLLRNVYSKREIAEHMQLKMTEDVYDETQPNKRITGLYSSKFWKLRVLDNEDIMVNPRNVMLSFSTDGFQPFTNRPDSMWPMAGSVNRHIILIVFYYFFLYYCDFPRLFLSIS